MPCAANPVLLWCSSDWGLTICLLWGGGRDQFKIGAAVAVEVDAAKCREVCGDGHQATMDSFCGQTGFISKVYEDGRCHVTFGSGDSHIYPVRITVLSVSLSTLMAPLDPSLFITRSAAAVGVKKVWHPSLPNLSYPLARCSALGVCTGIVAEHSICPGGG